MQAARPVRARWIAVNRTSPALWLPRLPRLTAATPTGGDAQCCCTLVRRVYGIRHEILRRRPRRSRRTRNATRTAAAHTRIRSENDACRTVVGGWWLVGGGRWHKCLCHSAERRTSAPNAADRRAERRPGRSACGRKPDAKRNRPPVWARAGRRRARWSRRSRRSVDAGPFMPARSMRAQRSEAGHGGVRAARHAHASPGRVLAGFQPSALYSR
ncbi:Uncharacterised protein [Burkholderia pseudomallei]|nr:Uncharacterised protein [Burkholderia pseudomallei]VBP84814.1 Uncharacterised protein [Burkholderia pseudomallei]